MARVTPELCNVPTIQLNNIGTYMEEVRNLQMGGSHLCLICGGGKEKFLSERDFTV